MTTTLVTTANGDTGGPMVDYLLKEGLDVRAMVRKDDARAQQLRDQGTEVVFGDLLNFRDVRAALKGAQRAYFNYPVGEGLVEAAATTRTGKWWSAGEPRSGSVQPNGLKPKQTLNATERWCSSHQTISQATNSQRSLPASSPRPAPAASNVTTPKAVY